LLQVAAQPDCILVRLLNVEAKELHFVSGVRMSAVPLAHPFHQLGVLRPTPNVGVTTDRLRGCPAAVLHIRGGQFRALPIGLHGESSETHLLDQETENAVLHAIEPAGGMVTLAKADQGRAADQVPQRLEICRRWEVRIVAEQSRGTVAIAECVSFDERYAGRVARAPHESGVSAGLKRLHKGSFQIIRRRNS
jgi:hypothetical protein